MAICWCFDNACKSAAYNKLYKEFLSAKLTAKLTAKLNASKLTIKHIFLGSTN